jgi:hypothetical protein
MSKGGFIIKLLELILLLGFIRELLISRPCTRKFYSLYNCACDSLTFQKHFFAKNVKYSFGVSIKRTFLAPPIFSLTSQSVKRLVINGDVGGV